MTRRFSWLWDNRPGKTHRSIKRKKGSLIKTNSKKADAVDKTLMAMFEGKLRTKPSHATMRVLWDLGLIEALPIPKGMLRDIPPGPLSASLLIQLSESGRVVAHSLLEGRERAAQKDQGGKQE